jgi:hypothetical protein
MHLFFRRRYSISRPFRRQGQDVLDRHAAERAMNPQGCKGCLVADGE